MTNELAFLLLLSVQRTMIRSLQLLVVGAVVFFLATGRGEAGLILDQSYDAFASGGGSFVSSDQLLSQTFTVGQSGLLAQVDVEVQLATIPPTDGLILSILGTTGGATDSSNVLGSVSISPSSVQPFDSSNGTFVSADVSGLGISVAPGDVLALELTYPTGAGAYVWWDTDIGSGYSGGREFFVRPPSTTWIDLDPYDAGFRTWVETAPVPEPSSFMLLSIGCCGLFSFGRKRKRKLAAGAA
jgi:PEP-CTERM motif